VPFPESGTTPQTASQLVLGWGRFFLGPRQRAALIRDRRLPRRQGQTISFDEHAVVFGLRPGKKADKREGSAKHQPYQPQSPNGDHEIAAARTVLIYSPVRR
jgi:hypothetical protein